MLQKPFRHLCVFIQGSKKKGEAELTLLSLSAGKALASPEPPRRYMCQGSAAQLLPAPRRSSFAVKDTSETGTGDSLANRHCLLHQDLLGGGNEKV